MKQGIRYLLGGATALAVGFGMAGCADPETATVFAAASLTTVGEELATAFTAEHPDAEVIFNFAGSSALVRQMNEGAPADLFISADVATMDKALELSEFSGSQSQIIATNRLVLVTADGNPAGITELADITDALIASCAPAVPCGTITGHALEHAGVELGLNSEEANVSDVATKISTGAVDAGFIYATDARALGMSQDNTLIELEGIQANEYPMALTTSGRDNATAQAFAQFLGTDNAREILTRHGFGTI